MENFSIKTGEDGTWLNFSASNGNKASIRVEAIAENVGHGIIGSTLRQWCEDRRVELETN